MFRSEIGSGFEDPGGTPPPRIPRSTPPPPRAYTPRSKLDHLVYVYMPRRKTKVRIIILPNKQVQQETITFQMSDIFSLVAVSQVSCNHSNRGRFRNVHYLVTVSINQKSVPPFNK